MALPLETRRLELRDFRPGDLPAVHACASDPLVTRFFPWGPNSESQTREFLDGVVRGATQHPRDSYVLAIVLREQALIGTCFLNRTGEREFELGYYLRRDHWNLGLATEAVGATIQFAFRELQADRIYARVDPENPASARVLEHLDFRLEDHFHRDRFLKGAWRDSLIYALVPEGGVTRRCS